MIAQNEIEVRRRRSRGSRQAKNAAGATPPNSPFRRERGVGLWGNTSRTVRGSSRGSAIRLQDPAPERAPGGSPFQNRLICALAHIFPPHGVIFL